MFDVDGKQYYDFLAAYSAVNQVRSFTASCSLPPSLSAASAAVITTARPPAAASAAAAPGPPRA
jgi:hypothetical protein